MKSQLFLTKQSQARTVNVKESKESKNRIQTNENKISLCEISVIVAIGETLFITQ